jgi:hypothetical protein
MCYTKTDGVSNPCWTCHTSVVTPNDLGDWKLQQEYAFGKDALKNRWTNLFADRTKSAAAISDADVLAYVRQDNYAPLVAALANKKAIQLRPRPRLCEGFDDEVFAKDASWRAVRANRFPARSADNGSADEHADPPAAVPRRRGGQAVARIYCLSRSSRRRQQRSVRVQGSRRDGSRSTRLLPQRLRRRRRETLRARRDDRRVAAHYVGGAAPFRRGGVGPAAGIPPHGALSRPGFAALSRRRIEESATRRAKTSRRRIRPRLGREGRRQSDIEPSAVYGARRSKVHRRRWMAYQRSSRTRADVRLQTQEHQFCMGCRRRRVAATRLRFTAQSAQPTDDRRTSRHEGRATGARHAEPSADVYRAYSAATSCAAGGELTRASSRAAR